MRLILLTLTALTFAFTASAGPGSAEDFSPVELSEDSKNADSPAAEAVATNLERSATASARRASEASASAEMSELRSRQRALLAIILLATAAPSGTAP